MQSKPIELHNAYTDAPDLHPNLILGSLHLLFWLFFHPSAWRNYVARIDPKLRADFCLADLSQAQWQHKILRRMAIQVLILHTLLAMVLLAASVPQRNLPFGISAGVIIFLIESVVLSVASGISAGVIFGLAFSLGFGTIVEWHALIYSMAGGISRGSA